MTRPKETIIDKKYFKGIGISRNAFYIRSDLKIRDENLWIKRIHDKDVGGISYSLDKYTGKLLMS